MIQKILFIVMFSVTTMLCYAEDITLKGSAPGQVAIGDQFRLTYTVNTQDVNDFKVGKIPDGLEVLMGPSTSSQSSFNFINGQATQTSSITYTYIICANKEGSFDIPAAQITSGGKTISSNIVHIQAYKDANRSSNSSKQSNNRGNYKQQQQQQQRNTDNNKITGQDLFIKVSASKKRVHEQEAILLTYKVYTQVELVQLEGKMPDLEGFYSQEIKLPQQKSFTVETINGKSYKTVVWSQYVMFPQKSGKLEIPSITFNGIVIQRNRYVDPFEAFFNGGSGYTEVQQKIKAPALSIEVDPLPERPNDFCGGVGKMDLVASIDKETVKANEPMTLHLTVSGVGNLKLIKTPTVAFPKDFDTYDAKITDKTRLTTNGIEGSMVYDILAIPRHKGTYEIPAVSLTYFDTASGKYKTLTTEPFSVNVEKGEENSSTGVFTAQEDLKLLNQDIRYIKTGYTKIKVEGETFFGSIAYRIVLIAVAIVTIVLCIILRRMIKNNANVGKMRGKRANKMAARRLKKAQNLMETGRSGEFYDEVLKTLWGYIGDKLNVPQESLTRDKISIFLSERGVSQENINKFIVALEECEFERYAPGDEKGNMNKTFDAAMSAIMNIEETMKKKSQGAKTSAIILIIIMLTSTFPLTIEAITKAEADEAYAKEDYSQAIKAYEEILKEGISSDIYYNLGNAYYRNNDFTHAILNYEKALLFSPGDEDAKFNLQMARARTIDKIAPESEAFIVTWWRMLANITSIDNWAYISVASFCLVAILLMLYLFSFRLSLKKIGFFGCILFFVIFILANIFAYQQKDTIENRTTAIVTANSVTVRSTPAKNGTDLFVLHEGTKVKITDPSLQGWCKIRLTDGKEGWLEISNIEII